MTESLRASNACKDFGRLRWRLVSSAAVFVCTVLFFVLVMSLSAQQQQQQRRQMRATGKSNEVELGWIHVGKTGGTSFEPILRYGCPLHRFVANGGMCTNSERYLTDNFESTVSKRVQQSYHVEDVDYDRFSSFLVSTRDPLNRTISAFLMHHPKNQNPDVDHSDDFVFACFDTLEHFGMALGGNIKGPKTVTDLRDGSVHHCDEIAQSLALGAMGMEEQSFPNISHLYYNYHAYLADMPDDKQVFVTRLSHLWDDFATINTMLGGSNLDRSKIIPKGKDSHRRDSSMLNYVVTNNLTQQARAYICQHLAHEYELYFDVLQRSVNLSKKQVLETIHAAKQSCPELSAAWQAFLETSS